MASVPQDLLYTPEHEWLSVDGEIVTIGITDFAQGELGDVVYVELPEIGAEFECADTFGTVESVKSVSDLFVPVSGEVVAINKELEGAPELVNEAPYKDGWLVQIRMSDPSQTGSMLDAEGYRALIAEDD